MNEDNLIIFKQRVEQIKDGSEYQGTLNFGVAQFDYKLIIIPPIPDINEMAIEKIDVTIKRDDVEIALTKNENIFFAAILINLILDFYFNPITRLMNTIPNPTVPFGEERIVAYTLTSAAHDIINLPKFGLKN